MAQPLQSSLIAADAIVKEFVSEIKSLETER